MLFDRLGPRWVYGAGTLCLGAAFFLAGGLGSLWQFYLCIGALVGLGVSLNGMVPGSALLARWYRARLSTAIGIAFSAVGVGMIALRPARAVPGHRLRLALSYRLMGCLLLLLAPLGPGGCPGAASRPGRRAARARRGTRSRARAGRCARRCARRCSGAWPGVLLHRGRRCSRWWCSWSPSSSTPDSRR